MRVSPDRTYWLSDSRKASDKGILECKTTQMRIDEDDIPKHWFCQVQYQLGVAELTQGSLAWLCSGREFGYKDIYSVKPVLEHGWYSSKIRSMSSDIGNFLWKNYKPNFPPYGKMTKVTITIKEEDEPDFVRVPDFKLYRDHPEALRKERKNRE